MIGLPRRKVKQPQPSERDKIEHELNISGGKVAHTVGYVGPPSRRNRRSLTTWQDETALQALNEIRFKTGKTMQALIAEGINHVLMKHGKPPLADQN
jgi:hypothetical protein